MKSNIMNYVNTLEGYKSYIKSSHWSAKNHSCHVVLDDIAEEVAENQDEVAEIAQGLFGQLNIKDLKPKSMDFVSPKDMLNNLIKDTNAFYKTINGEQFIGMRSVIEAFLGNLNKFVYLLDLCLKEDIKRRLNKSRINENKKIKVTEGELRSIIKESVARALRKL